VPPPPDPLSRPLSGGVMPPSSRRPRRPRRRCPSHLMPPSCAPPRTNCQALLAIARPTSVLVCDLPIRYLPSHPELAYPSEAPGLVLKDGLALQQGCPLTAYMCLQSPQLILTNQSSSFAVPLVVLLFGIQLLPLLLLSVPSSSGSHC
jgi:hypothetical protein